MGSNKEVSVSTQPLVLVADDEPRITKLVSIALGEEGFRVVTATSGEEALAKAEEVRPDIVLLDIVMPDLDGIEVMRQLRERRPVAVILLTAKGSTADKAKGLDLGADDYIAKPFNPRELLARIRAVLRRAQNRPAAEPETVTRFGPFELDLNAHRLTREGKPVSLTSGEFDLLVILVAHPNKVLDRDRLLDLLTGAERSPFDRSIDVRVTRLRGKIETNPSEPVYIKTIWGKGYMFCPDGA